MYLQQNQWFLDPDVLDTPTDCYLPSLEWSFQLAYFTAHQALLSSVCQR